MPWSLPTFSHGVHPHEHKEPTAGLAIERMPFVTTYLLPLSMHAGAPSKVIVEPGQPVSRGQLIGEPSGFVSVGTHSPVTGTVRTIGPRRHPNGSLVPTIEIAADAYADQRFEGDAIDWQSLDQKAFISHMQRAGVVGLGGAAFPAHVKYSLPEGKRCDHLVLNGSECEPYLTTDHRMMVEHADDIVRGTEILLAKVPAPEAVIGVEMNKPDAIEALRAAIPGGAPIRVAPLAVKYPQGAEKMLIKAVFGREVPAGKLPLDLNMVVNNVGTASAIATYFDTGQPLIERVVTVSGPGVERPANLMVPIGTPVREVLAHCGLRSDTEQVLMGGPMMGQPLASLDVPVLKGTSGLLAFTAEAVLERKEQACIRCGRCLEACPQYLNPSQLARLARSSEYDRANDDFYLMDCVECGACTYVCPSSIPIVQLIRMTKSFVRSRKKPS